ncbi:MAG TPA: hypothetical protein PK367_00090 [Candidatus Paceibacterota bacterium]|nr:hypothetical protein [Candidatus Paceibacterota bacterium]
MSHPALRDFYSEEGRVYKFKIGKLLASSLSGFVAGILFTLVAIIGAYFIIEILKSNLS